MSRFLKTLFLSLLLFVTGFVGAFAAVGDIGLIGNLGTGATVAAERAIFLTQTNSASYCDQNGANCGIAFPTGATLPFASGTNCSTVPGGWNAFGNDRIQSGTTQVLIGYGPAPIVGYSNGAPIYGPAPVVDYVDLFFCNRGDGPCGNHPITCSGGSCVYRCADQILPRWPNGEGVACYYNYRNLRCRENNYYACPYWGEDYNQPIYGAPPIIGYQQIPIYGPQPPIYRNDPVYTNVTYCRKR